MKLTWLGATAFRVYIGGAIVVVDPDTAPAAVDRGELRAGADHLVGLSDATIPTVDPAGWRPKPSPRATDEGHVALEIARLAAAAVLIAAPGEPPLVILGPGDLPRFGRWADGAIVVLTSVSGSLVAEATALLDVSRLRLIGLAVDDQRLDEAIEELAEHLDGAGLVSLEPGLAVEL